MPRAERHLVFSQAQNHERENPLSRGYSEYLLCYPTVLGIVDTDFQVKRCDSFLVNISRALQYLARPMGDVESEKFMNVADL